MAALSAGCGQRQLIQTPNLFLSGRIDPFDACPPAAQNNFVDVIYATDRLPVDRKGGGKEYGYHRSPSLALGRCRVEIGDDVPWSILEKNSRTKKREVSLPLSIRGISEIGRFPATPIPLVRRGNDLVDDPRVVARSEDVASTFRNELTRRLAQTPCKEAFVFIHGYNNSFQDSVFVMADLWHFLGRKGLPIVYSWPAGRGGLRGYNYDSESGEFTVLHLKQFLKILATCPDLEKVHLLAHSRGAEVLVSAVREIVIEARAAGDDPREILKIADLALAAPDLDLEVFAQRTAGERIGQSMGRVTIYVSEEDKALGLSTWLSSGVQRLGRVAFDTLDQSTKSRLGQLRNATVVDSRVPSGFIGHSYFHSDPAVSSDLILLMGFNRNPGVEHGRPLLLVGPNYWRIEKGYPNWSH